MTTNNKLRKFNKRWKKTRKLAEIVQAMDKNDDYEDVFNAYSRDFLEFLQTNYDGNDYIDEEILKFFSGGVKQRSDFAKEVYKNRRVRDTQYGLNNLKDIVDDLSGKLEDIVVSLVPIKDADLDKADDLDELIDSYKDNINTLKSNLKDINQEKEPQRYKAQEKTIEEYEEFASLLKDYKGLVGAIVKYRELAQYLKGEKGRPDNNKMKELFDSYLDRLTEKYKAQGGDKYDNNAPLIEAAKALSGNPNYLVNYYVSSLLEPAKENLDIKTEKADLKDYIKRNVRVANPNKQMQFLDVVYALSQQEDYK